MTSTNVHIPEGATIATLDMLKRANEKTVLAPLASAKNGAPLYVRIRTIRRARYVAMLPPRPTEADAWPKDLDEYAKHEEAWLATLPAEQRAERQAARERVGEKILEAG